MHLESLASFLNMIRNVGKDYKVYIWGTGIYGNLLGKLFNEEEVAWAGYYDNFVSLSHLNSKNVFSATQINVLEKATYILTMRDYTGVRKQLLSLGIEEDNIIFFENANDLTKITEIMVESPASKDKIKSLHNVHLGERCFIIGNGPSLCVEDINRIHEFGIASFGSNMIYRCFNQTSWRPEYYFLVDVDIIRDICSDESLKYIAQNCKCVFGRTSGELAQHINEISNLVLFKSVLSESEQQFDFSDDCSEQIYGGYTVSYAMLQMAVYMGYRQIYLLGMDHNYSVEIIGDTVVVQKNVRDHSELVGGYQSQRGNSYKATRAYESAKKYADEHGIKIYNATRGGKLEIFERVDFNEVFA